MLLVFICQFWVIQMTSFLEYFWETYFKYKLQDSAASRCILVPFERYGRPKNVFPCMFHVKPKWNIVYKYLKNKKFFKIPKYRSQTHWTSNIFVHSATIIGGLGVSLNYPILNFKKTVFPKTYGCSTAGKKYFTSASQAFYTRTRSSYSKARSSHQRCSIKKVLLEIS